MNTTSVCTDSQYISAGECTTPRRFTQGDLSAAVSDSESEDEMECSRWENQTRPPQLSQYGEKYRNKELKIPGIQNIPHRYVRKVRKYRPVGKTKYDKVEEKWAIAILNKYFILTPTEICEILKINARTVWNNIELYQVYGPRGLIEDVVREKLTDVYLQEYGKDIKDYANQSFRNGETLSFRNTYKYLREKRNQSNLSSELIREVMKKLGYSYCKTRAINYKEKNKGRVISMREIYIQNFFRNRSLGCESKREIYVDESFVRDIQQTRHFWMTEEEQKVRTVPIASISNQIAIVGAIAQDGWVGVDYSTLTQIIRNTKDKYTFTCGGLLYYKTRNPDLSDPHTCFTSDSFQSYFTKHLLPALGSHQSSMIIMDRAPYHTKVAETEFNIRKASKQELLEFLIENGETETIESKGSTQDLRYRVLKLYPDARSYLEIEAELFGHQILFTPPYHPELNPIELAWSMIKRPILEKAHPTTNYICEEILPKSFTLVTPAVARKLFAHVEKELLKFREDVANSGIKIEGIDTYTKLENDNYTNYDQYED